MTLHQKPNTLQTDSFWMPFTANRAFKRAPRLMASASGMYYRDVEGRSILDGAVGALTVGSNPIDAALIAACDEDTALAAVTLSVALPTVITLRRG